MANASRNFTDRWYERAQDEIERANAMMDQKRHLSALLVKIRAAIGRDKLAGMLPPELNAELIEAIGDGVQ